MSRQAAKDTFLAVACPLVAVLMFGLAFNVAGIWESTVKIALVTAGIFFILATIGAIRAVFSELTSGRENP